MTFSVIIPVYNAEKYIDSALKPVIAAGEKGCDLEAILVENGSEDGSAIICDRYADKYDFIRTSHFGKIGAFRARLEGMKLAGGEYLIFADADDELAEDNFDKLSDCISFYGERSITPDLIIYNAADSKDRNGKLFSFPFEEGKVYSGEEKRVFYDIMSSSDALNAMWNKAVRRDFIRETDSFEGVLLNHGEDLLQTAEFIDKAKTIVYIDKALYYYNQNSSGLTGSFHKEYMDDQITAWKKFDKYIEKWHRDGDGYWDILARRKTLTCAIAVKSLIYSGIRRADIARFLKEMMDMPFYKEYAGEPLPEWAPEADVFVYKLMNSDKPYSNMMRSASKFAIKSKVKKILGWKEDVNNGN
ncbi:glycosyltransferase [Butyrivibrio sp. VCB2006]|uniref:glycosyltransferase n=1 Tax=Butyrivibrio sp. VCB2006 TaxID=1280679 RepID=UPI0003FC5198|nr:glycosyltransferase [Butyrivibrio sp. VCB2006]